MYGKNDVFSSLNMYCTGYDLYTVVTHILIYIRGSGDYLSMTEKIIETLNHTTNKHATSVFRLGGPDPLDYISMYSNPGDPSRGIPAHWHYITFGLSDLHGDGRVHE